MTCTGCGSNLNPNGANCSVCGYITGTDGDVRWDRSIESALIEDVQAELETGEAILAATRGRVAGSWRKRMTFGPGLLMAPSVNVCLTGKRLFLQQINPKNGTRADNISIDIPLTNLTSIQTSDADPFASGRSVRLMVTTDDGESFRIRTAGRLAEAAREMEEVWRSMVSPTSDSPLIECGECGKRWDRNHKFCPFCGKPKGVTTHD